jgi:hypothetical protein
MQGTGSDTAGRNAAALGPTFEEIRDSLLSWRPSGNEGGWGGLTRPSKPDPAFSGRLVPVRELRMMRWVSGPVYAGEVPAACFDVAKPHLRRFLDRGGLTAHALSPKACAGVLERDKGRGRQMPAHLTEALAARAAGA